jgi:peptide/nickel transport system ATP-binding protein
MAGILDPEVLILDEPTSALDAANKGIVGEVIDQSKSSGKSVLLITHDLEFASQNADSMAVLYLGQIMEILPAGDFLIEPRHPYTLALARSYPTMTTDRDLGGIRGDAFYRMIHQHGRRDGEKYRHSHIQVPGSSHKDGHAPPEGCLFQNRCTQAIERCLHEDVHLERIGNHTVRCLRHGIADLLTLQGVGKRYGKIRALNPTDLVLRCGEVCSLVGETGSGKTTLAMTAAGALDPDVGERIFHQSDRDLEKGGGTRFLARRIGVVYQNPAESVSHRFSVFDIVAEPLKIHEPGMPKAEVMAHVTRVLREVHLSTDASFLARYPHELNMGAIQRVCIARALVLKPSLVVADEPTSSLDPSVQAKILKLLLDLQTERGLTMLFVTHDMGVARKISDRLGVMLRGDLVEVGPASPMMTFPAHPYTRFLVESVGGSRKGVHRRSEEEEAEGGCPFFIRCPRAQRICENETPALRRWDHRQVACHFPEKQGSDSRTYSDT